MTGHILHTAGLWVGGGGGDTYPRARIHNLEGITATQCNKLSGVNITACSLSTSYIFPAGLEEEEEE